MGVIFSSRKDKKEYYKKEAQDLRRRADKVERETQDSVEASRLRSLAEKSENQAEAIKEELENVSE